MILSQILCKALLSWDPALGQWSKDCYLLIHSGTGKFVVKFLEKILVNSSKQSSLGEIKGSSDNKNLN